jgi:hypothetical protein
VFFFEHFQSVEFGNIGYSEPCRRRELPNASVDPELSELQENIPPQ